MTEEKRIRSRRLLRILCFAVPILLLITIWVAYRDYDSALKPDYTQTSPDKSPYLRGVAEPITMVSSEGVSESDNVWMGLTFKDSLGVERRARYIKYRPAMSRTLILGEEGPTGGEEERAFIGLLQRWYRQHRDEVAELSAEYDRLRRAQTEYEPYFQPFPPQQRAKLVARAFLRSLLATD